MARVSKWGNSLAVRLPSAVVRGLDLKDGDEIDVAFSSDRSIEVRPETRRAQALDAIGRRGWTLPPGYKFDRQEANRRGGRD